MTLDALKKLNLPDGPGIYLFKKGTIILYIGRATSLKDRVRSYFGDDLIQTRGPFIVDMVTQASTVEWQTCASVLESIILEANEIRKHKPKYNTKEKDNRSYNYVVITAEDFPRVILVRSRAIDMDALDVKVKYKFGPYPHGGLLREALVILRKIFPFRDAKSSLASSDAFYRSLGLSPDTASPDAKKQYAKTIRNIRYFFLGRTGEIVKLLKKEMAAYAKAKEFEKAGAVRNTLYALEHIQDVALIKKESEFGSDAPYRIEAYDIAHMSGKNVVGVMTVIENGEANKAEYRKFKIKVDANNDVGNLKEIISRRFTHSEWRMPDLIVVDGGEAQKNAIEKMIAGMVGSTGSFPKIPVVSVLKDERHKPKDILGTYDPVHKTNILIANSEAHRFAIAYHRLRRGIIR
jgi:excinuclease ABC subunit C